MAVLRHTGHLRPWAGPRRGHRHVDRARQDRVAAAGASTTEATHPCKTRLDHVGKQLALARCRAWRRSSSPWAPSPASRSPISCSRRSASPSPWSPRGLPAVVTFTARHRRAADAPTQRPHPQAARRRDARFGHGHLLGQDGHAHAEPHDGHRRRPGRSRRSPSDGSAPSVPVDRHPSRPSSSRWPPARSATTPTSRTDGGRLAELLLGDPTETAHAWVAAAQRAGIDVGALRAGASPRAGEQPFDSERKRMSTVHAAARRRRARRAGRRCRSDRAARLRQGFAVDGLAAARTRVGVARRRPGADRRRPAATHHGWRPPTTELAADGIRVLGVACRTLASTPTPTRRPPSEEDLTLPGPASASSTRPVDEVRDAVATCRTAPASAW